jgi:hypothetical protein
LELIAAAEEVGIEVLDIQAAGSHARILMRYKGVEAMCFAATTPGCWRDIMNTQRDMKRAFINYKPRS